jgi:hypothetical protein
MLLVFISFVNVTDPPYVTYLHVANIDLQSAIQAHKARRKKDKEVL